MYKELVLYLEESGYLAIFSDKERLDSFFQNLTGQQFKEMVIGLNQKLRGLTSLDECLSSNMTAGDIVAPTVEIRDDIIEGLVETLKGLSDNKKRAALVYYTMIDLHMFSDGNGRTSRLMYDLICNELGDSSWYIHGDDEPHRYTVDFEMYKDIPDIAEINFEANRSLIDVVAPYVTEYQDKVIGKYIVVGLGGFANDRSFVRDVMPSDAKEHFSDEYLEKIDMIMCDSGNEDNTISGLAFLCVALEKGQLQQWIDIDDEANEKYGDIYDGKRLCFRVRQAPWMFDSWAPGDYENIVNYGNYFKLEQFKRLNDMFLGDEKKSNKML